MRLRCWAKPIIPQNANEKRLPKSTGRAEVTVLPRNFSSRSVAVAKAAGRLTYFTKCARTNLQCERIRATQTRTRRGARRWLVADAGVEVGRESPISRFEPVAGVVHTLVLLLLLAARSEEHTSEL